MYRYNNRPRGRRALVLRGGLEVANLGRRWGLGKTRWDGRGDNVTGHCDLEARWQG
jgi:hypothetical protein